MTPDAGPWKNVVWTDSVRPVRRLLSVEPIVADTKSAPRRAVVAVGNTTASYWIKTLDGPEGACALIAEAIVSRLGALIGAPVCETAFVETRGFAGSPPGSLDTAYAYGSLDIPDAEVSYLVKHRTRGDNTLRAARLDVLYRWCLGGDDQWLYERSQARRMYSHDHGRWLLDTTSKLTGPPSWSASSLAAAIDQDRRSSQLSRAADAEESRRAMSRVAAVTHGDLVSVLDPLSAAWSHAGISFSDGLGLDDTLRYVGNWLEERRARLCGLT